MRLATFTSLVALAIPAPRTRLARRTRSRRPGSVTTVLGMPFYFAKVYDQVRVCWSNQIADQKYDEVFYAPRAAPQPSPQHYENVVAFYARRDKEWFYVLAGVPGK